MCVNVYEHVGVCVICVIHFRAAPRCALASRISSEVHMLQLSNKHALFVYAPTDTHTHTLAHIKHYLYAHMKHYYYIAYIRYTSARTMRGLVLCFVQNALWLLHASCTDYRVHTTHNTPHTTDGDRCARLERDRDLTHIRAQAAPHTHMCARMTRVAEWLHLFRECVRL